MFAISATTATPPAFAVTRHDNGSVSVKITRRSGIVGANRTLAAMGIHDRVVGRSDGQTFQVSCLAPGPGADGNSLTITGYPTTPTGPSFAPSGAAAAAGTGITGAGRPAIGSAWYVVDCSSLSTAG